MEDVSNMKLRYRFIKECSGSKPATTEGQTGIATAAMFCINEAWFDCLVHGKSSYVNLHRLITSNYVDLRMIAVVGN